MMPESSSKIALVTGASSGIGYEISKTLAKAGIITIGIARRFENLLELQKKLQLENIDHFIPMNVDITDKNKVFACASYIQSFYGNINILVNNAGCMQYGEMMDCDLNNWLEMVNVNCVGFLYVLAAILPHMKHKKSGHIINISSDAGIRAFAGLGVYSGSKFFMEAVSDVLRQEVIEHNIKVTCIRPGDVRTGLHEKSTDKQALQKYIYKIPYLDVKDIANTVMFCLNQPDNCAVNAVLIEPRLGPI